MDSRVLIRIHSVTGQLVLSRETILPAGTNTEVFELDEKGIYFVEINSADGQAYRKLVVQ
jgi:hypothetical protein